MTDGTFEEWANRSITGYWRYEILKGQFVVIHYERNGVYETLPQVQINVAMRREVEAHARAAGIWRGSPTETSDLIKSILAAAHELVTRDLSSDEVREALADLRNDQGLRALLFDHQMPEGSEILIVYPGITPRDLTDALRRVLKPVSTNLQVLVYDTTHVPARPRVCMECAGTGKVYDVPQDAICQACNGKGLLL